MEIGEVRTWLELQGLEVEEQGLEAVLRWYRAWREEWRRAGDVNPATLPAPLWCWPPRHDADADRHAAPLL